MPLGAIIAIIATSAVLLSAVISLFVTAFGTSRITLIGKEGEVDPYANLDNEKFDGIRENFISLIDKISAEEYESVSIRSRDGLALAGRLYHRRDGAPLRILVHGFRSHPLRDFAGVSCDTLAEGHNLLLIHQRATCPSEGKYVAFGAKEKYDLVDWISFARERLGEVDIVIMGMSMGAATVLLASELELPENVKCIVADCPFSSAEDEIKLVAAREKLNPTVGYFFVSMGAAMFHRTSLSRAAAKDAVKRSRLPILIMHGEDDRLVPPEMGREIYDSCTSEKKMITFPGARHGTAYLSDPKRYNAELNSFIYTYINK